VYSADQYMYGLKTWGKSNSELVPAKKPTKFMTNSRARGRELSKRCTGAHKHQRLVDGRALHAARYPEELCRAICRGIVREKEERNKGIRAVIEIGEGDVRRRLDPEEHHEKSETEIQLFPLFKFTQVTRDRNEVSGALAWDDLTGMRLSADRVIEARSEEIQYVKDMGVWTKIPRTNGAGTWMEGHQDAADRH